LPEPDGRTRRSRQQRPAVSVLCMTSFTTSLFQAGGRFRALCLTLDVLPRRNVMDIFGSTDPKKMPMHFFWSALSVDHRTAVRANTKKQNYSVCPRHWYINANFKCERCGQEYTWTAGEQKAWFEDFFFWVDSQPRRCSNCRAEQRHLLKLQKEYDATVASARNHGTPDQKRRIIEIVSELQQSLGRLPEKMVETKDLFERQSRNQAEPNGPANGSQPFRSE
jgi:hypothetical protein